MLEKTATAELIRPARKQQLDLIDRKILTILQDDASTPIAQIASRVGLSQTPCWNRIQRLERDGVIRGRVALINAASVGLPLTVLVSVQLADHSQKSQDTLRQAVARFPEIVEVFRLAGDIDYQLRLAVRNHAEFDLLYQSLAATVAAKSITSRFVLETLKDRGPLPIGLEQI
ncbi:Lrp/AsnC family transcriptional regulator [Roseiarcaceae bacterium H3SJ34-1]|uniref:Lrp/AsnC family transcriptional regulator n=1 Tax=Terripilifer ovatus TaxID=3032367 RepID=UPI003AB928C8|nr:Lrp/AsnC family transcriptional regulator [Roseiarcaceae bacterium H3SJ34-1]